MQLEHLYHSSTHEDFQDAISQLFKNKSKKKALLKASEEFLELSLAIVQHFTKETPEDDIKEELVDAWMNLNLLAKYYSLEECSVIFEKKTKKMRVTQKKYINARATDSINT